MESEQSQNFNERLSQWVANQGFWFQVRYSMSGSGSKGTMMFHLLRLVSRLLLFMVIVAIGGWIYLFKVTGTEKFNDKLEESIRAGLAAGKTEMTGFSRSQGQLGINRLVSEGGNKTFFSMLEARNIRSRMGLLDGVTGKWDAGTVQISMLDLELRAGADDAESAAAFAASVFDRSDRVRVAMLDVADASLRWGYSARTRGAIEHSVMKIQRYDDSLRVSFKGGTFSQNWLRDLEIVHLVVSCNREGMTFEKAEFRSGSGSVNFTGLKVAGGERPTVTGVAKIRRLAMEDALPVAQRSFLEGSFSGDFQVSGSTNSAAGVGFAGQVTLDGQVISLRQRLHLLKALSNLDFVRNYRRVDFNEGSFQIKTTDGGLEITDLSLKAGELFTLDGAMKVRLPTPEETKAAAEAGTVAGGAAIFSSEDTAGDQLESKMNDKEFSLKGAGEASNSSLPGLQRVGSPPTVMSDRLVTSLAERQLAALVSERQSRTLRYEGLFRITLPPDAFERAPRLVQQFPVDSATNRIPLEVPIQGNLYEITLKQAEELYIQGRR